LANAAPQRNGQLVPTPAETQFERVLANASRLGIVLISIVLVLTALKIGQVILAPVLLAVTIGLMFGPLADRVERFGVPPALSAGVIVLLLIAVIATGILLFAVPLSEWIGEVPRIWDKLKTELMSFKQVLAALSALQDQIRNLVGGSNAMSVQVESGSTLTDIAFLAPAIGAQALIFLASLYFFLATREHIRISVLSLCVSRRMRWRTAHVFRDVERRVSRFLLSVTAINLCVGLAVSLAMWAIGMPSPVLWGAMAAVLNYIPYVGQGTMVVMLLLVGFGTQDGLQAMLTPTVLYLAINFLEGQIITPHLIGRTLTLNPFLIFLSISFWLWIWGPIGGLVAVPALLILTSLLHHVLPNQTIEEAPIPARVRARVVREAGEEIAAKRREEEEAAAAEAAAKQKEAEPEPEKPAKPARKSRRRTEPPAGTAPDGTAAAS
jgi:predicted PurR-regulated permease PerM